MKKTIVFTVLGLLLSMVPDVSAQEYIRWGNPRYMFHDKTQRTHQHNIFASAEHYWHHLNCESCFITPDNAPECSGYGRLISYFTKDSLKVYGVAITLNSVDCDTLIPIGFHGTLGMRSAGIMDIIDSAKASNGIDVNRFIFSILGDGVLYEDTVPVYEFYFNEPHVLCGKFYVGYYRPYVPNEPYLNGYHIETYWTRGDSIFPSHTCCIDPRACNPLCADYSGVNQFIEPMWTIFPILQPCAPPEMSLDVVDDWEKVLSWSGDVQDSFQLSVSEYRQPADSGNIYNLTDTTITFLDGQGDVYFAARVRVKCTSNEAKCPADDRWSPWSEPVYFYFGSEMPDTTHIDTTNIDTTSTGLRLVESGNVDVTLTPNPAAERVTVSAEGMQSVELLGVDGTVIMRREGLQQNEYILNLKGLAAGTM